MEDLVGTFTLVKTGSGFSFVYIKRRSDDDIEPSKLTVPGGHVRNGETASEAAKREVFEETGINNFLKFEFVEGFNLAMGATEYNILVFFAYAVPAKLKPEKGTNIELIPLSEFEKLWLKSVSRDANLCEFTSADIEAIKRFGHIILDLADLAIANAKVYV
ncbi:MAG: NUDIX domain-containing protein [Candidatus Micrarchaeia archaeon]|jgi:8-oxo-dGTP pyrophosphatase MutT (NUDIX family)